MLRASTDPVTNVVGVGAQVEVFGPKTGRGVTAMEDMQIAVWFEMEIEVGGEPVD